MQYDDEVSFDPQRVLLEEKARIDRRRWRTISQIMAAVVLSGVIALAFAVEPLRPHFDQTDIELPAVTNAGLAAASVARAGWWIVAVGFACVSVGIWTRRLDRILRPMIAATVGAAVILLVLAAAPLHSFQKLTWALEQHASAASDD
jgi:type II secretory pathway component PulF